jgi:hypothetical protein
MEKELKMELTYREAIFVQSALYDMLDSMVEDVELDYDSADADFRIASIEALIAKVDKFILSEDAK